MLKKNQRLSRSEFANLLKYGKRVYGTHFSLLYLPAPTLKCGLVVSKKVAKKAVVRNKLRRQVYAIFGANLQALNGMHCALLTRPSIVTLSYPVLKHEIEQAIETIFSNGK